MDRVSKLKSIVVALLGFLLAFSPVMLAPSPALAVSFPLATSDARIVAALDFLKDSQNSDGSIGSNVEMSCYAIVAIAAGGRDPHSYKKGGTSVVDYIRSRAASQAQPPETKEALPYAYYLFAIAAAGENPWDFGGVNFVDGLKAMFDGEQIGKPGLINDDFWGIITLIGVGESPGSTIIQKSKAHILAHQNDDGGWGFTPAGASDVCNTANALMALIAAGQSSSSQAVQKGLEFIKLAQNDDGGFPWHAGGQSDIASNARVIAAIRASGGDPTSARWTKNGHNPVEHALSLQRADGGFDWKEGSAVNCEWMISYILPPLVGKYWPTRIISDTRKPTVSNLNPPSGATVDTGMPAISAAYSDNFSGIDTSSVTLKVNGADVTSKATVTETGVSYTPTTALEDGTRSAQLTVYDRAGNRAHRAWSFIVDTTPAADTTSPVITNLNPPSGATVDTGRPTISASYSDIGSGVKTASVSLKVNGVLVDATVTGARVSYTPAVPLSSGKHHIELKVNDTEGNQAHRTWSFRVEALLSGVIELAGKIDASGRVMEAVELASADKKVDLKLPEGTTALTVAGTPVKRITIEPSVESPSLPADTYSIGLTYDLGPDGTNFNPPVTLTLHYDEVAFPGGKAWDVNGDGSVNILDVAIVTSPGWEGVDEENFRIAGFDTSRNEWVILGDSVVNTAQNTVTTGVSHFSQFTIVGNVIETPLTSAVFVVKSVEVTPETVRPGEKVTIAVAVVNSGEAEGSHNLSLKINGEFEALEEVALPPGEEQKVTFTITRQSPGTYQVEVNGQVAEFTVKELPIPSEEIPTNDSSIEELPLPEEESPTNWALIGGIIVAAVAITTAVIIARGRRRGRT